MLAHKTRRGILAILCLLALGASAAAANYTVLPEAGTGGTISPSSPQTVSPNAFLTFTATPNAGYVVDQWLVNGTGAKDADGSTSFTDGPIVSNETVKVTFIKAPQSRSWVDRWALSYTSTTGYYEAHIDTFDEWGNSYHIDTLTPDKGNPEIVIRETDPYGSQTGEMTVPVPVYGTATGFAADGLGDRFLLSDQLNSSDGGTAVLQGWDSNWKPLFDLTLPKPSGNETDATGLGLKTDSQNFVYAAESLQGVTNASYDCVYTKFNRLGAQQFSVSAPFFSDSVQFDSFGRCAFTGNTVNNGFETGANAVVFDNHAGATVFSQSLTNTSSTQFYFGGGNFDPGGDFYLNTITSTSESVTSSLAAYGPTFAKLYSTTIPGYASGGAANSPYESYVWGYSSLSSSAQFMALVIYGFIQWNASTNGLDISTFSARAATGILQNSQTGELSIVQWDRMTGATDPLKTIYAPSGWKPGDTLVSNVQNICDCCCDCFGCCSYLAAFSYANLAGNALPTTVNAQMASYVFAFRDGVSLNMLAAPATVSSGGKFNVTLGANVPLTEGQIFLDLSATNGTFSTGLATANAAIGAPDQQTGVAMKAAATNVAENLTISAKAQGVLRLATVKILPPAISVIAVNAAVTAASATTDPFKVSLNGLAGAGGVGITVTSSNTAVIPNASATVPANGAIASGTLTVNKVIAQGTVTLTFKTSTGSTATRVVTVSP